MNFTLERLYRSIFLTKKGLILHYKILAEHIVFIGIVMINYQAPPSYSGFP
ncbi:MAG: hypothetical protein ACI89T_002344 [Cognaticolwellia sp.]